MIIFWLEFFPSHLEKVRQCQKTSKLQAHFLAASLAAPMVVTVWNSVAEFQDLAMRFAAKMLLPGTGQVAFKLLIDLVGQTKQRGIKVSLWQIRVTNSSQGTLITAFECDHTKCALTMIFRETAAIILTLSFITKLKAPLQSK